MRQEGLEEGADFPPCPPGELCLTTVTTPNGSGQPLAIDPPGYGTSDTTAFLYDVPGAHGLLASQRTDPLVGTTHFGYDPFNRRTHVTNPNLEETVTAYDALDRVVSVTASGPPALVTSYHYTPLGDLFCLVLPRGNAIEYAHDGAGRVTAELRGRALAVPEWPACLDPGLPRERRFWTLDGAGQRTNEKLQRDEGGGGDLWVDHAETSWVYASRCHLEKVIQAPERLGEEAVTEYAYDDCTGNLTAVWDPLHPRPANPPSTTYAYDELGRLVAVTQPWGGNGGGEVVTSYAYDVQDHLVRVTDGEGNETEYTYSDRDLLTREDSPVSGVTEHAYTEHGELRRTTDARAVTVTRTVDAADRVTFADYPDDDLDRTYTYGTDPLAHELGRLVAIANATATVEYGYDAHGRLTQDGELLYAHDENGNRTAITYPDGLVATYAHDDMDRELSLTVQPAGGAAVPVVTASPGASYRPFGPLAGLTFGTVPPTTETRGHDFRYAPASIALSGGQLAWTYTTDPNGNVLAIDDTTSANQDRSFGYQPWQQYLTTGHGPWGGLRVFRYDRIGNRVQEGSPGYWNPYSYVPNPAGGNTPTLAAAFFDLRLNRSYEFDDAGFLTRTFTPSRPTEPTAYFTFDTAGTLTALDAGGKPLAFAYDGRGLLARAMLGESPYALPTYSSAGQLLSLHDVFFDGSPERRTHLLYFAARPVAQWREEAGGKGGGGGSLSSPPTTSAPPPARWPPTPRSPGRAASSPSAATGSTAPRRAPSRAASSCASPGSGTTPTGTATCAPKASAPISSTTSTAGTRRGRGGMCRLTRPRPSSRSSYLALVRPHPVPFESHSYREPTGPTLMATPTQSTILTSSGWGLSDPAAMGFLTASKTRSASDAVSAMTSASICPTVPRSGRGPRPFSSLPCLSSSPSLRTASAATCG
ncbi:MAG: hypothetical protein M5U13_13515 [Thermoanaerobaculia bacterium]|nr:hypothetical protein [Thermoanaerobaculia bacterium]